MAQSVQGASAPTVFQFRSTEVRTLVLDGEGWFVASDVAKALGYRDARHMTRYLDDDEKGLRIVETLGGLQELSIINESGLYHAVLKSRKPEARPFRKWVTSEVLPAIRKTGQYVMPEAKARVGGGLKAAIVAAVKDAVTQLVPTAAPTPAPARDRVPEGYIRVRRQHLSELYCDLPRLLHLPASELPANVQKLRERVDGLGWMEADLSPSWWQERRLPNVVPPRLGDARLLLSRHRSVHDI